MNKDFGTFPDCLNFVPPVWDLDQYVAVNPFLAWTDRDFEVAMQALEEQTGAMMVSEISSNTPSRGPAYRDWHPDEPASLIGPFLGSYYGAGSAIVSAPWKDEPLWQAWKSSLPGSVGLGWRRSRRLAALVKTLPDAPEQALLCLETASTDSKIDSEKVLKLLARVPGWAAYLRQRAWPQSSSSAGELAQLAVILAALEFVSPAPLFSTTPSSSPLGERVNALQIREAKYRQNLIQLLASGPATGTTPPQVRAAFCIDVRSEVFRRHWEQSDPRVATDGFAGFFGLPLEWQTGESSEALLPVLLVPQIRFVKKSPGYRKHGIGKLAVTGSPNFSLVEVTGWKSLFDFASGAKLHPKAPDYHGIEEAIRGLPVAEKGTWATSVLTNLGWNGRLTELMVLVGHGSSSVNNPQSAGLDCGACGGRTGEANARAAAALLNDPETRQALAEQGLAISETTWFVGALHDTTLDTLRFWDENLPSRSRALLESLKKPMIEAGRKASLERQNTFAFLTDPAQKRSTDEAQTRPETALAGNAAFLVAPRAISQGLDLAGRVFLHSYQPELDPDGKVLELILSAPVVVATWINLQYYASTVAPSIYGAGDKLLHTRLGSVGVMEGNSPDLKVGLAEQSVFWQGQAYHDPMRLQVFIMAPKQRVEGVLAAHPEVRSLFDHGWATLVVQESSGSWQRWNQGKWDDEN